MESRKKTRLPVATVSMALVKLIFFNLLTIRPSYQCVAMKPPDFDDIIPLTRIPPTSAARTTTQPSLTTTTIATTTEKRDPCDDCMLPEIFPVTDSTFCGSTDTSLPAITVHAMTDGTTCQLAASGCTGYQTMLTDGACLSDLFMTNPVCEDGYFVGSEGKGIARIRCAF